MNHLHPDVRHYLSMPPERRTFYLRSERWIGYREADRVRAELEILFARPRVSRMPGILLVGDPNQGKSTILKKFRATHPTVDDPAAEHASVPVLMIECPPGPRWDGSPGPDERRFYHALLTALNAPFRYSSRIEEKHSMLKDLLGKVGTRILVLDEIHNVLVGTHSRQRYFMQVLKYVSNDLSLPVVLAGNSDARQVISTDDQLARRFRSVVLPKWREKRDFEMLLNSFEQLLPLKKPSNLRAASITSELLTLSEGILGEVAYLLTEAACAAVASGAEQITLQGIRKVAFVPPSQRRDRPGGWYDDADGDDAQAA